MGVVICVVVCACVYVYFYMRAYCICVCMYVYMYVCVCMYNYECNLFSLYICMSKFVCAHACFACMCGSIMPTCYRAWECLPNTSEVAT